MLMQFVNLIRMLSSIVCWCDKYGWALYHYSVPGSTNETCRDFHFLTKTAKKIQEFKKLEVLKLYPKSSIIVNKP